MSSSSLTPCRPWSSGSPTEARRNQGSCVSDPAMRRTDGDLIMRRDQERRALANLAQEASQVSPKLTHPDPKRLGVLILLWHDTAHCEHKKCNHKASRSIDAWGSYVTAAPYPLLLPQHNPFGPPSSARRESFRITRCEAAFSAITVAITSPNSCFSKLKLSAAAAASVVWHARRRRRKRAGPPVRPRSSAGKNPLLPWLRA